MIEGKKNTKNEKDELVVTVMKMTNEKNYDIMLQAHEVVLEAEAEMEEMLKNH